MLDEARLTLLKQIAHGLAAGVRPLPCEVVDSRPDRWKIWSTRWSILKTTR